MYANVDKRQVRLHAENEEPAKRKGNSPHVSASLPAWTPLDGDKSISISFVMRRPTSLRAVVKPCAWILVVVRSVEVDKGRESQRERELPRLDELDGAGGR